MESIHIMNIIRLYKPNEKECFLTRCNGTFRKTNYVYDKKLNKNTTWFYECSNCREPVIDSSVTTSFNGNK